MFLLRWAAFLVIAAIIAAVLGFTDLAAGFADVAKVFFYIFLVGVVVLVALGVFVFKKVT
jgi:uncharacterized membrane protein YtjA (UPF0391 family)